MNGHYKAIGCWWLWRPVNKTSVCALGHLYWVSTVVNHLEIKERLTRVFISSKCDLVCQWYLIFKNKFSMKEQNRFKKLSAVAKLTFSSIISFTKFPSIDTKERKLIKKWSAIAHRSQSRLPQWCLWNATDNALGLCRVSIIFIDVFWRYFTRIPYMA